MTLLPNCRQPSMLSPRHAFGVAIAMICVAGLLLPTILRIQQEAQMEQAISTTELILRTLRQSAQQRDRGCSFSLVGSAVTIQPNNCWTDAPLNFANISAALRIDPDSTLVGTDVAIFQPNGTIDLDDASQGRRVLVLEHLHLPSRRCVEIVDNGGINSGAWDGRKCE